MPLQDICRAFQLLVMSAIFADLDILSSLFSEMFRCRKQKSYGTYSPKDNIPKDHINLEYFTSHIVYVNHKVYPHGPKVLLT